LTNFNATVLLSARTQIPVKKSDGTEFEQPIEECLSFNSRTLGVIQLFDKGYCKVSSISAVPNKGNEFAFKVDFHTVRSSETVETIIEKFHQVFSIRSISEVAKK